MAPAGADTMENIPILGDVLQSLLHSTQTSKGPYAATHAGGLHATVALNTVQRHANMNMNMNMNMNTYYSPALIRNTR